MNLKIFNRKIKASQASTKKIDPPDDEKKTSQKYRFLPPFKGINKKKQLLILLFLASLLVRLLLLFPLITSSTPVKYDEQRYFVRAEGFYGIFKNLAACKSPDAGDMEKAYKRGIWPPFHSILLACGFLLFGKSITTARLIVAVVSALTTILVFLLTEKLANKKAATAAAVFFIFFPGFLAFSHFLWSETTFIFLLLLAVYLAMRIPEQKILKKKILFAILSGVTSGLLVLTRAAALLFLFVIPAWVLLNLKNKREKIVIPVIIVVTLFAVIFPWEYTLVAKEKRFVLLSTYSNRNLYLGNNQWVRDDIEFGAEELDYKPQRELRKYAKEHSLHIEKAALKLALKEITADFGAFAGRSIKKFLLLWTINFFPLRHMFNVVYPPMGNGAALFIFFIFALGCLLFFIFLLNGFFSGVIRGKNIILLLCLTAAGMIPYILAFAHTRFNLPQVALLLPVVGVGITNMKKKWPRSAVYAAVAILCFFALSFYTYHNYLYKKLNPSSHYRSAINLLDGLLNRRTTFIDVLELKSKDAAQSDMVTLTIVGGSGYSFERGKDLHMIKTKVQKGRFVKIFSRHPADTLALSLYSEKQERTTLVKPISRYYWHKNQPVLGDLLLNWRGGY